NPNLLSGAVQIAIWAEEYPGLIYSGGGAPDSLPAIQAEVNFLLNTNLGAATGVALLDRTEGGRFYLEQTLFIPTPEPASIAIAGVGLLGLGWFRRKRG